MTLNYADYWSIEDGKLICHAPSIKPSIIRRVIYPLTTIQESGDDIIRHVKFDAVKKLMTPLFAEIIISAIHRCKGERP